MEQQILEKATHLFLTRGFKSVTMDDIATEMAISKKTIYQYYSSKLELVEKTIYNINTRILKELHAQLDYNLDPILEIIQAHHKIDEIFTIDNSAALYQLKKYYPKLAQKSRAKYLAEYISVIKENIRKGIQQGYYRKEIDIEFTARFFFASIQTLEDTEFFPETEFDLLKNHKMHLEYYLRSIASEKGIKTINELKTNP